MCDCQYPGQARRVRLDHAYVEPCEGRGWTPPDPVRPPDDNPNAVALWEHLMASRGREMEGSN
jgi:hypothetical protein